MLLEALTMRLHGKVKSEDILGEELRKIALRAAASHLTKMTLSPEVWVIIDSRRF